MTESARYSIFNTPNGRKIFYEHRQEGIDGRILGAHVKSIGLRTLLRGKKQPLLREDELRTRLPEMSSSHKAVIDFGDEESPAQVHIYDPNLTKEERGIFEAYLLARSRHAGEEQPDTR